MNINLKFAFPHSWNCVAFSAWLLSTLNRMCLQMGDCYPQSFSDSVSSSVAYDLVKTIIVGVGTACERISQLETSFPITYARIKNRKWSGCQQRDHMKSGAFYVNITQRRAKNWSRPHWTNWWIKQICPNEKFKVIVKGHYPFVF